MANPCSKTLHIIILLVGIEQKQKLSAKQNKSKNGRKEKDNMNKRDEVRIYDPDLDTDKKGHIVFIIEILL